MPISGANPSSYGWVKVGDLLWVGPTEGEAWATPEGRAAALSGNGGPSDFRVRTAHVFLHSNARPPGSVAVARLAEAHVQNLFARFGDALDLRSPVEPLPLVLHANRSSFGLVLAQAAPGHPGWGAFYDATHGTVHVCVEDAPRGALPLGADVRHEMTHQVLDLSTPAVGRSRIFGGHYLWLWEGFAVWTEGLGDTPGEDTRQPRRKRFLTRRARGEVEPLATLVRLDQSAFEGRHYDQCGILLDFLMRDGVEGGRNAVLSTLADVLRDRAAPHTFEQRIGMDIAALDAAWRHEW